MSETDTFVQDVLLLGEGWGWGVCGAATKGPRAAEGQAVKVKGPLRVLRGGQAPLSQCLSDLQAMPSSLPSS
jgi:hypothetical protein